MMRSVWESPTNEGTECYTVGYGRNYLGMEKDENGNFRDKHEWTVGKIFMEQSETWGVDFGARIIVMDTEGERRVSLPAASCAWEWDPNGQDCCEPEEGEDD